MAEYGKRDPITLDKSGGHFCRHIAAMTAEGLHSKFDIAAELAWRDERIASLEAQLAALPEVVAALEAAEGLFSFFGYHGPIRLQVRAALAKVRG